MQRIKMPISRAWLQGALLTYLVGFTILGVLAYLTYAKQPPIPNEVRSSGGALLYTKRDALRGMDVFRRYGLMEYGSIYGHGAYLGPDFTADYLHRSALLLLKKNSDPAASAARVAQELVGLLTKREQGFVVSDFWRFWVVHLWVEDFLELFTTVIVAYVFVLLGLVREKTAIRIIYLDLVLYSIGGVVGTMHHLYFSGAPAAHMALGATFSAMEVIPLLLLTLEAWAFMRSGERSIADRGHPHKWAVWFLIAVGFWNFLGAGVFGFLINLPAVSYYEIGTNLTANHAHTSMMGVYGMLAVGLLLFCLRYLTDESKWNDRAAGLSFFSLNLGLAWMSFVNLFPVGVIQLHRALNSSYSDARSPEFLAQHWVNLLEWARLPGDAIFILGGAIPLCFVCWNALRFPNPKRTAPETELAAQLFRSYDPTSLKSEQARRAPDAGDSG